MPETPRTHDPNPGVALALLWIATSVIAIAAYGILSAARIFEEQVGLEMPSTFSRGTGWYLAIAWLIASGAVAVLRRGPVARFIGLAVLCAYFAGIVMLVLAFVSTIWSPTWSLQ